LARDSRQNCLLWFAINTLTYQFTFIFYPAQGSLGQVLKTVPGSKDRVLVSQSTLVIE